MESNKPECTLYWFPFSLYSLLCRFTAVLGAEQEPDKAPRMKLRMTNIHRKGGMEHVSEWYLAINPKGQVPCMTAPSLLAPLTDSLDIVFWLAAQTPKLLGGEHEPDVKRLLKQMHDFHAISLTVSAEDIKEANDNPESFGCAAEEVLHKSDPSDAYRAALKSSSEFQRKSYYDALSYANVAKTEAKARAVLAEVAEEYRKYGAGSTWLYGDETGPTALDAYAVTLMARLFDNHREEIAPSELREYAKNIIAGDAWNSVTHGRPTMWNPSIGHVHLLDPL